MYGAFVGNVTLAMSRASISCQGILEASSASGWNRSITESCENPVLMQIFWNRQ